MNSSILDENPKWMKTASEEELREFLVILDSHPDHPNYKMQLSSFDSECYRRMNEEYELRNGGEWI